MEGFSGVTSIERWLSSWDPNTPKRILVWGTGSTATALLDAYPELEVEAFIDNNPKSGSFRGAPVHAPDAIQVTPDVALLIASEFDDEIRPQASRLGFATMQVRAFYTLMLEDADACLVSYQKCGRTWLRMMIGRFLQRKHGLPEEEVLRITESGMRFRNLGSGFPILVAHHDDAAHRRPAQALSADKSDYRDRRVLFLCRDPRDVVVSNFYHMTYRAKRNALDIDSFARETFPGIIRFYNIWARAGVRNFHLVRYEDLKTDPVHELRGVLRFVLEEEPGALHHLIEEAVEFCSFGRMKEYERENRFRTSILSAPSGDPRAAKVRSGKSGGFRSELSDDTVEFCTRALTELDPDFGYT